MGENLIKVDQSQNILVVQQDKLLTIRETDWNRLKRLVDACKVSVEWWSVAASVFGGISGSAALSALAIPKEQGWNMRQIMFIIAGAAIVCAIICVIAAIGKGKVWNNGIDEVKQTINDVETLLKED